MPVAVDLDLPRVPHAAIVIDGRADEAGWDAGLRLGDLVTFEPVPGQVPVGTTAVTILADDAALYLRFVVVDPQPGRVRATLGRRDSRFSDDFVGLYLDLGGGGQRAYVFICNPLGLQMDGIAPAGDDEDFSWDTRWESAGAKTADGYAVELAIPWRAVRHGDDVQETGLLVFRRRAMDSEQSSWPTLDPNVQGALVQEALLRGPGPLPRATTLDVTPSLTFGHGSAGPADGWLSLGGVSPGVTVQWSPTAADTVLATVNPDFSQVESDAAQIGVNRRYALYYDEKRPFFLEGQEWFASPLENLVYTRSMVTPWFGARATTDRSGWQAAALNVIDADPSPSVSEGGGWTEGELAGTSAVATLGRLRRQVGQDGYVGAIYSDRAVPGADLSNRAGGVDARVRVNDRVVIEGAALGSHTTLADGSSISGPAAALSADYQGKHLNINTEGELLSPGFRAENGFLTRSDRVGGWVEGGYAIYPDGKIIRQINFLPVDAYAWWTTGGAMRDVIVEPDISWRWGNGTFSFVEAQLIGESYAGEWFEYTRGEGGGGGQFNPWVGAYVFAGFGEGVLYDEADPRLGQRDWVSLEPSFQPFHWLGVDVSASYERFNETDGTPVYAGWAGRVGVEAFATGQLWTRLIVDHSTFDGQTDAEALLAWERSPGRAIYLGGASQVQADPDWQVFAKLSWVLSI